MVGRARQSTGDWQLDMPGLLSPTSRPSNIETVPVVASPDQAPPVTTEPPPAGAATVTAIDYVNLRSGPGTNYLLLGTVAPGAVGEVTGKSEDGLWWQVKVPTSFYAPGFAWVST